MASKIPNSLRDQLISAFRGKLAEVHEVTPFPHQAGWWAASDGLILTDQQTDKDDPQSQAILLPDHSIEYRMTIPRPSGRARVIADLGAFKIGKSFSSAFWVSSFAVVPGARIQLVGLEYDICAPEFEYLCQFLLSSPPGGGDPLFKAASLQNRPRDGRMWLDLENGARFEAKSWERKDTMKGKEIDCYLYCEAYMLPGLECYTSFSQNLRARDGYAIFATTPDRPWVKDIHEAAHSGREEFKAWHCTCSVHSSQNPFTFDQAAMDRDRNLMTREKFTIHYEGKLGDFVGRVYNYQRGDATFTPTSHPFLFKDGIPTRENLIVPEGWEIGKAADTGTFSSAALVMFNQDGEAFVIDEFPNYRYVSSVIELDESSTIPSWCREVKQRCDLLGSRPIFYADKNSQFKREYINYGLQLLANNTPLETRTEISREYFTHNAIHLAPWLKILPFELENASWPEEASASGKFARVKDRDHTLDCLEHILSKRPRGKWAMKDSTPKRWIETFVGPAALRRKRRDSHLGNR